MANWQKSLQGMTIYKNKHLVLIYDGMAGIYGVACQTTVFNRQKNPATLSEPHSNMKVPMLAFRDQH